MMRAKDKIVAALRIFFDLQGYLYRSWADW